MRPYLRTLLALVGLSLLSGCGTVREAPPPLPEQALRAVPLCYEAGCQIRSQFEVLPQEWARVAAAFEPPAPDAAAERQQIRRAVALMERLAGSKTPTWRDRGGNPWIQPTPGLMDCVDESTNTTTYLQLFAQHGLLRWHTVGRRAYRARWLYDLHYVAHIREAHSGQHYIVDSWPLDNGEPPYVQRLEDWYDKQPWDPAENPALEDL